MPGVGFIGGKLSVIGGYSWPGGVKLIETWNDITDEWDKNNFTLKYPRYYVILRLRFFKLKTPVIMVPLKDCILNFRYNHGTITVPGEMFPQCVNPEI